jgi:hypothetical protein
MFTENLVIRYRPLVRITAFKDTFLDILGLENILAEYSSASIAAISSAWACCLASLRPGRVRQG